MMKKWLFTLVLVAALSLGVISAYAQDDPEAPLCGWADGEFQGPCWHLFYGGGELPEGWPEDMPCPMFGLDPENLPEGFRAGPGRMWNIDPENLPEGWPEDMPHGPGMMWFVDPENLPEGFEFGPGRMWNIDPENLPEGWPENMPHGPGMMWFAHPDELPEGWMDNMPHGMMGRGHRSGHHGGMMDGHRGMMGGRRG